MYDLPGLQAPAPVTSPDAPGRPRLRVVPDVPLDFEAAVRTLTPRLVRYAARRLGDAHEAEEVVQEALLRAYKHRLELLTEDDLAAWSTCVTGRLVIDRLRVRGRSTSVADVPEGARVGRDTADVVVARDEARTALDSLDAMPTRQAAVLWAREVEGLAYDEIGARFGMTEPAVRSILTRARKALRKEYAARGGTLPAGGLAAIAPWADGLGWLDRLRGAVGRMTAPAALSAVGVGILGGSMLLIPSLQPVTDAPHSVQTTVMTVVDSPTVLRGAATALTRDQATPLAASVRPVGESTGASNTGASNAIRQAANGAIGCNAYFQEVPVVGGPAGAGSGDCAGGRGSTIFVDQNLPVVGYVGVTTDDECPDTTALPAQPIVKCVNEPAPANGGTQ